VKKLIKKIFREFGIEITRYNPYSDNMPNLHEQLVSLKPENISQGNALISYRLEPFLKNADESLLNKHNNYWRSLRMAETFLEIGFCVDVIDYRNKTFIPEKEYAFFIDVRHNFERLSPYLNKDCVKIMYIDTAHILFHNAAEARRLLELQQRKGVTLRPQRLSLPNLAIEYADCAITHGNKFTINTFAYAHKPIYRIPQSTYYTYPLPEDKNYEMCRKNYLWFGSDGFVHKGLDLVLDAFAEMPDYHLYICGPIQKEKDVQKVYYRELYETSNIHTIGWVDVNSREFHEIIQKCIALIYPSCSEGGAGSVVTCMHAGIIPVASYESGVDIEDDYGVILKDCSVDAIRNTIKMISSLPVEKLRQMTYKAWEYARAHHTRERFDEEYKKTISIILGSSRM
jgi:glycosyltransferase involved in cell wall biosynthesis